MRGASGVCDLAPARRFHRSRRGHRMRLAAGAAALAITALVALGVAGGASETPRQVTVHAGDTLWSIASAAYGGVDVQARVIQIEDANHLTGPALKPGEVLILPGS
jgi:nucleoid-associated protein YgaU